MNAEHAKSYRYFSELSGLSVPRWNTENGFSILEVLVATTIVAMGLVSLAQLFAISMTANLHARATTVAAVLAGQKMEQLRGLTWGFDVAGLPVSDPGLSASPSGTLQADVAGYVDYLDANGNVLDGAAMLPSGTIYYRRWSVEPLPTQPDNTLVLQVVVARRRAWPGSDDVRLVSVKTRKSD